MQTLLAFDYGAQRIGVAVGQTVTSTARALTTLQALSGAPDWERIETLIGEWRPDLLLVGLPLMADGSESPTCREARAFAAQLSEYGRAVQLIDEHLTSNDASAIIASERRSGVRSKRSKKGDIDALSAVLIAEQWLRERDIRSQN